MPLEADRQLCVLNKSPVQGPEVKGQAVIQGRPTGVAAWADERRVRLRGRACVVSA